MDTREIYQQTDSTQLPNLAKDELQALDQKKLPIVLSRWMRTIGILAVIVACLATGGCILYHQYYYASYQPAQCMLQDKQIQYIQPSGSDSSSYYEPDFTYQISTADGKTLDIWEGYIGPGASQSQFQSSTEVQTILDQYQIGQSYPCWYSTFGLQPEAELVLQPYSWIEITLASLGTFITGFLLSAIIFMLTFGLFRVRQSSRKDKVSVIVVFSLLLLFFIPCFFLMIYMLWRA